MMKDSLMHQLEISLLRGNPEDSYCTGESKSPIYPLTLPYYF